MSCDPIPWPQHGGQAADTLQAAQRKVIVHGDAGLIVGKVQLGVWLHVAAVLTSVALTLKPVVGENPVTRETGSVDLAQTHPSPGQPAKEDGQLCGPHADCPGQNFNQVHRFVVRDASHCTAEMHWAY